MTITLSIPANMVHLTGGLSELTAHGGNVLEVINDLESRYPGMRGGLIAENKVHRFMNIYLNDEDIRFTDGLQTAVRDGDFLTLLCAVAGG